MIHFSFYVPESHAEIVKESLFNIGVGCIGNYDHCCFQLEGIGQFRPLTGAQPFLGETNKVEFVKEYKIEMVCEDHLLDLAVETLKKSHPYETPAYYAIKVLS